MLKKRLLFVLLWDGGSFSLSRNFRLQHVGNFQWLTQQYDFGTVAASIDELVLLDVTRGPRQSTAFLDIVSELAAAFQMPLAVGGGIVTSEQARLAMLAGADKIVINTGLVTAPAVVADIVRNSGRQSLIGSVDARKARDGFDAFINDGSLDVGELSTFLQESFVADLGEILLNNIDADGTGRGIDFTILDQLPPELEQQIILMGGVGKPDHVADALMNERVDAVATANLLNFIGSGLGLARGICQARGIPLPMRDTY